VLLVEPPSFTEPKNTGFDRFGSLAFIFAWVDYLEERDDLNHRAVAIHGIGAGMFLARRAAHFDERIRLTGNTPRAASARDDVVLQGFIGADR
jgi:hypothetical protein